MAEAHALGVVVIERGGGLSRKVLVAGLDIFLEIAAKEEVILAVHVVVDLGNAGVERGGRGGREENLSAVEAAVTTNGAGGGGLSGKICIHGFVGSGALRADRRAVEGVRGAGGIRRYNLLGRECIRLAGCRVGVIEAAAHEGGRGHSGSDDIVGGNALAFVVEEEKELVFEDGTAEATAEGVHQIKGRGVRRTGGHIVVLEEVLVGDDVVRAIVLVERAMKLVGSALGDEVDLCAGGAARGRGAVGGGDAKFLSGVERGAQDAGEGGAEDLVVVVESVESDVALVRASAGDCALAAVTDFRTHVENAGLEAEQADRVAAIHGQRLDGGGADRVAHGGVSEVERLRRGAYVYGDRFSLHAEDEVDGGRLVNEQFRSAGLGGKATGSDGDEVVGRRNNREDVISCGVGDSTIGVAGGGVSDGNGCALDKCTAGVADDAAQRRGCSLAE